MFTSYFMDMMSGVLRPAFSARKSRTTTTFAPWCVRPVDESTHRLTVWPMSCQQYDSTTTTSNKQQATTNSHAKEDLTICLAQKRSVLRQQIIWKPLGQVSYFSLGRQPSPSGGLWLAIRLDPPKQEAAGARNNCSLTLLIGDSNRI